MTKFSFENFGSLNCSESYAIFLEKIVDEYSKAKNEGKGYKLVKIDSCIELLKGEGLSEDIIVYSRREFATITWTVYQDIPYLKQAMRARCALDKIVSFNLFREYSCEYTIETFLFYFPFSGCMPTISMFTLQDKLKFHITFAFDELKRVKRALWDTLEEKEKIPYTFTEIVKKARKVCIIKHPDKFYLNEGSKDLLKYEENFDKFKEAYLKFNENYEKYNLTLKNYGITSPQADLLFEQNNM